MESPMNKISTPPLLASATFASWREIQFVGKSRGVGVSAGFCAKAWPEISVAIASRKDLIFIKLILPKFLHCVELFHKFAYLATVVFTCRYILYIMNFPAI